MNAQAEKFRKITMKVLTMQLNSGYAVLYKSTENRKNITVGVNAGHGTQGGSSVKTLDKVAFGKELKKYGSVKL